MGAAAGQTLLQQQDICVQRNQPAGQMFHIAGGAIAELKQKQEEVDRFENGFNLTKLNIDNIQVQVTAVIN